jgi:hypothetical protein
MSEHAIEWNGDDDFRHARWRGLYASCEQMNRESWSVAVGRIGERDPFFHSQERDILPLSAAGARTLAELVMRAEVFTEGIES